MCGSRKQESCSYTGAGLTIIKHLFLQSLHWFLYTTIHTQNSKMMVVRSHVWSVSSQKLTYKTRMRSVEKQYHSVQHIQQHINPSSPPSIHSPTIISHQKFTKSTCCPIHGTIRLVRIYQSRSATNSWQCAVRLVFEYMRISRLCVVQKTPLPEPYDCVFAFCLRSRLASKSGFDVWGRKPRMLSPEKFTERVCVMTHQQMVSEK